MKGKTGDGRLLMEMVDAEIEEGRKYDDEVAEREGRCRVATKRNTPTVHV